MLEKLRRLTRLAGTGLAIMLGACGGAAPVASEAVPAETAPDEPLVVTNASEVRDAVARGYQVDWPASRQLMQQHPDYQPYSYSVDESMARRTLAAGDIDGALAACEQFRDTMYADFSAWVFCLEAYAGAGRDILAEEAGTIAADILRQILVAHRRDGRSPDTAIVVTSIDEEYLILQFGGYRSQVQQLVQDEDGRSFDYFDVVDVETGEEAEFWFDITGVFARVPSSFWRARALLRGAPA